jgi:hypothetical protein
VILTCWFVFQSYGNSENADSLNRGAAFAIVKNAQAPWETRPTAAKPPTSSATTYQPYFCLEARPVKGDRREAGAALRLEKRCGAFAPGIRRLHAQCRASESAASGRSVTVFAGSGSSAL